MSSEIKFLADFMLGRLAKSLRLLGYDCEYIRANERSDITTISLKERRVVLSRHTKLSAKKCWKLILIKSDDPVLQLQQVRTECGLVADKSQLFTRCTLCNKKVVTVDKTEVVGKVPEYIIKTHKEFSSCPVCKRIYWAGTHYDLTISRLKSVELL